MLRLDSKVHKVIPCELSRWLKREYPNKDTFVYHHLQYDTYVIAIWIHKAQRICQEVIVLPSLGKLSREEKDRINRLLRRGLIGERKDIARFLRDRDRLWVRRAASENEETRELFRFIHDNVRSRAQRDNPTLRALAGIT